MHTVRAANADDAPAIHRLSAALGYEQQDAQTTKRRLRQLLDSEADQVWVAQSDEEILGWLHAFVAHRLASAPFLEIGGLVVGEAARRRGVGRALVLRARERARELGMPLRVRCNAQRVDSHAFCRAIGLRSLKAQEVFTEDPIETPIARNSP